MMNLEGRVMAVDIGTKRVGLAISDPMGLTYRSLGHIKGKGKKEIITKISDIVDKNSPRLVVVGVPLNMDGSAGPMAQKAKKFARALQNSVDIPVRTIDERLTTKEAERILLEGDVSRKGRKEVIDGLAATIILEKYIQKEKRRKALKDENS